MLRLPDDWVWDFWLADDGRYHLFFLFAPRALQDERRRHHRAAIGHAVSDDLRTWVQVSDALAASDPPAFDDLATWTGSVVQGTDGRWWLFYTGASRVDDHIRQTIGAATSTDLEVWRKDPSSPLVTADDRWYERLGGGIWPEEAWRDPWVLADPDGHGWHMLITARANHGPPENRGVIGHARSPDLRRWDVLPPISEPSTGFNYLECPQIATVEDRHVLLFSCLDPQPSATYRAAGTWGIWYVPIDSPTTPFDTAAARPLTNDAFYCGRIIHDRAGQAVLLAFHYFDQGRQFLGELSDPMPVGWEHNELKIIKPA